MSDSPLDYAAAGQRGASDPVGSLHPSALASRQGRLASRKGLRPRFLYKTRVWSIAPTGGPAGTNPQVSRDGCAGVLAKKSRGLRGGVGPQEASSQPR